MTKNKADNLFGTNFTHLGTKVTKNLFHEQDQSFSITADDDPAIIFTFTHNERMRYLAVNNILKDRNTLVVFHRCDEVSERAITKRSNKDAVPRYRVGIEKELVHFKKNQNKVPETVLFVELSKSADQVKHALLVEVLPGVSEGVCHGVKTDAYAYKRIATVDTVSVATGIVKALNGAGISHLLWPNFTHQSSPWWC